MVACIMPSPTAKRVGLLDDYVDDGSAHARLPGIGQPRYRHGPKLMETTLRTLWDDAGRLLRPPRPTAWDR
jgi:hypothetical protein